MAERDLHRLIRRELRDLDVTPPLDVDELCQALSERRGRPLYLREASFPKPGPSGLWFEPTGKNCDVILYQRETSRTHQDHIILHEVGHILAGHEGIDVDADILRKALGAHCPGLVTRVMGRTSYEEKEEREAELVATIILEWASVLDQVTPRRASDPSLQRIEAALGDRRGWL
ncbi:hypothetical protein EST92_17285 [Streptomyces sp. TM32]|nr:hypothetical protein EST92_17285 [Streptomyces sp. TM32]